MNAEVSEFLDEIAQTISNNRDVLGCGYMGQLLEKATAFCANFNMTEQNVVEYLNNQLHPAPKLFS